MAFLPVLGAVASAGGALLGGISQARAASYQAKVAENNAKAMQQNAAAAGQSTAVRTEQAGLKAAQQLSRVETGLAANNIDVSTGSAADVRESEHVLGIQDQTLVANQGARTVYNYEQQARTYGYQAAVDRSEIGSDILGGVLGAIGSVGKNAGAFGIGGTPSGGSDADDDSDTTLASGGGNLPDTHAWMHINSGSDGDWDQFIAEGGN